ncbi:unnamed protein product [Phaeothamnion confervicola]
MFAISEETGEKSCGELCVQLDQEKPLCAAAGVLASGTLFSGLSLGHHSLATFSADDGEKAQGDSSWFHVSAGLSAQNEALGFKAHLVYIKQGANTNRLPVSVSRFDVDLQLAEAYMQRFGISGFAFVKPTDSESAPPYSAEDADVVENKAATTLKDVLARELFLEEMRSMKGTFLSINGSFIGTDVIPALKIYPMMYSGMVLEDPVASANLFSALDRALSVNPSFAEAAHLYLNLAWDLKMPQKAIEKAVRIAWQSIEAGRSYDPTPTHFQPSRPVGDILLLTVASHSKPQLELLRRSAVAVGIGLRVEGLGDPWRGLGSKVAYMRDALEGADNNTLVLFLDAFDTLFLPAATALVQRFLWIGADLVFGAELACSPDDSLRLLYPPHLVAAKAFLNSGTYVGRASDVRRMLDEIAEDLRRHHAAFGGDVLGVDDQRWFTRFFLRHANTSHVVLDTARALFLPLHSVPPSDLVIVPGDPALFRYGPTGGSPCVLHGNGNGRDVVFEKTEELMKVAGWPPPDATAIAAAA